MLLSLLSELGPFHHSTIPPSSGFFSFCAMEASVLPDLGLLMFTLRREASLLLELVCRLLAAN
jgi:hypothetical protein